MITLRLFLTFSITFLLHQVVFAYLPQHPITFELRAEKESYAEGERITLLLTITNTDANRMLPVLLPTNRAAGPKLFYLNVYDKANNTLLLRYSEPRPTTPAANADGKVEIRYLKPLEKTVIRLTLNAEDNEQKDLESIISHHGFDSPLFAGQYKVNVTYFPQASTLGDSLYTFYNDFDKLLPNNGKQLLPEQGQLSPMMNLTIKRSADTLVSIDRKLFYVKTDGYYYYYFDRPVTKINTSEGCVHVTSLPPDSSAVKNEYYYNQFDERYNEYIARFEDGDIREYRKFTNWCPEYLYTLSYNALKQQTQFEQQEPDGRFYSVTYDQPSGRMQQESWCSEDGTQCTVTTYRYNKKGELVSKQTEQTEPCAIVEINGQRRSVQKAVNLEER